MTRMLPTLATASLLTLAAAPALAQDEGIKIAIDQITCREMLKMTTDERDFTMVFMHGYISGTQQNLEFDAPALTAATDSVLENCIDSPDAALLSTFEKARG